MKQHYGRSALHFGGCWVFLLLMSGCTGVFCDQSYTPVCGADGKVYEDGCRGAMVVEQYCEDPYNSTIVKEAVLSCPADYACLGGQCAQVKCTDSDGGENAAVKGTAVKSGESKTDTCQNNVMLTEYYCLDNGIASKNVSCQEGSECSDGACRTICVSGSGGAAGSYDIYKKNSVVSGVTNGTDYCVDSAKAMKYYCGPAGVESKSVACLSGYKCYNGACTWSP